MTESKKILSVYIGKNDIFEWTKGGGKDILMPELLVGCEELLYEDKDEILCLRVESLVRGTQMSFDFKVNRNGVSETLEKIMEWALQNEEYEICERVKNLNEFILKG
jgi:hypothetical protein